MNDEELSKVYSRCRAIESDVRTLEALLDPVFERDRCHESMIILVKSKIIVSNAIIKEAEAMIQERMAKK